MRLVSYSTKRRGRANAPWARRIFDATALDHPAFAATPENRAAMMMGILRLLSAKNEVELDAVAAMASSRCHLASMASP